MAFTNRVEKRGAIGHIEIIISFIVFVGFLIFLFYIFDPFKKSGVNTSMLNIVEEALRKDTEISVIATSVVLNTSAGYPAGFQPCFRLGGNLSNEVGDADVILVTDVSSSMSYTLNSTIGNQVDGETRTCDDSRLFDNTTKKISLTKCLSKQFVNTILNISGNQIGLVSYDNRSVGIALTSDNNSLAAAIDSYTLAQGTCICCGINQAHTLLSSGDPSKRRFVFVMTDGQANHRCTASTLPNPVNASCGTSGGVVQFRQFNGTRITGNSCGNPPTCVHPNYNAPSNNTVWSSNRTHIELNATLSTIGMGDVGKCYNANLTMAETARVGGGLYRSGTDANTLADIYSFFAQSVFAFEPLSSLIPPTYQVAAENAENGLVDANSSDAIYLDFSGPFYNLYFSDHFNQGGLETSPCKVLTRGNYSLGLIQQKTFFSNKSLSLLMTSYLNDYENLKNTLLIPSGLEFGFIVRDPQGNVLFQAINRKATKVHVLARDFPIELIDENGRVQNAIINIQVW